MLLSLSTTPLSQATASVTVQAITRRPALDGKISPTPIVCVELLDRYADICLHGTIVGSKFLMLGESGRDPGDLKLSSPFIAPVNCLGINLVSIVNLISTKALLRRKSISSIQIDTRVRKITF